MNGLLISLKVKTVIIFTKEDVFQQRKFYDCTATLIPNYGDKTQTYAVPNRKLVDLKPYCQFEDIDGENMSTSSDKETNN